MAFDDAMMARGATRGEVAELAIVASLALNEISLAIEALVAEDQAEARRYSDVLMERSKALSELFDTLVGYTGDE